ncbi:hypothetical protein [Glutamicibacter arilaitensis]|uniref:hypothetical protein n=1 Tax=Glutamicibacter arilaitensis TaxID=256701 RepID=UPI003FCFE82A
MGDNKECYKQDEDANLFPDLLADFDCFSHDDAPLAHSEVVTGQVACLGDLNV